MNKLRRDTYDEWPFETCKFCGNRIIPWFSVSDEIWEAIICNDSTICIACFDREAQKKNIKYEIKNFGFILWTDIESEEKNV